MNNPEPLDPRKRGSLRDNTFKQDQPLTLQCELCQVPFPTAGRRESGRVAVRTGRSEGRASPGPQTGPLGDNYRVITTLSSAPAHPLPPTRIPSWEGRGQLASAGPPPARRAQARGQRTRRPGSGRSGCLALPWSCPGLAKERGWASGQPGRTKPARGGCDGVSPSARPALSPGHVL